MRYTFFPVLADLINYSLNHGTVKHLTINLFTGCHAEEHNDEASGERPRLPRPTPSQTLCFSLVGTVSPGTSRAMLLILCRKCCTQRMFLKRAVPAPGEATRAGRSLTHSHGAAGSHYRSSMGSRSGESIRTRDSDRLPDCKIRSTSER